MIKDILEVPVDIMLNVLTNRCQFVREKVVLKPVQSKPDIRFRQGKKDQ